MTAPDAAVDSPPAPTGSTQVADPPGADSADRPGWRRWVLLGLIGLLVVLAVAAVVLGLQLRREAQEEQAREDALRYAEQTAINLTSISVADLDTDIQQVLDSATGQFREDFAARQENLRSVLTSNEVVSEGTVLESGLVRADEDTATALVVVDATVRNTMNPEGGVTTYRMQLELERQGDRWLTSSLQFVA